MKKQTIQTTFRDNGGKSRRKKNASGALATNAQKKVIAPEALPQGRGGRHRHLTMTTTTAGARSTATAGTTNTVATNTSLRSHGKKRRKKRQGSRWGRDENVVEERGLFIAQKSPSTEKPRRQKQLIQRPSASDD